MRSPDRLRVLLDSIPKTLTSQMAYLLVDRLGGLGNRPVHHLPFSRAKYSLVWEFETLQQEISKCMEEHGILLVQPEHVLSLKLASMERQLSKHKFSVPSLKLHNLINYDVPAFARQCVSMMITGSTTFGLADH